jgi:hypothetical protein
VSDHKRISHSFQVIFQVASFQAVVAFIRFEFLTASLAVLNLIFVSHGRYGSVWFQGPMHRLHGQVGRESAACKFTNFLRFCWIKVECAFYQRLVVGVLDYRRNPFWEVRTNAFHSMDNACELDFGLFGIGVLC